MLFQGVILMCRKCLKRAFCTVTTNQLAHALIEPLPKAKLNRTELADKNNCRLSIRKQVSTMAANSNSAIEKDLSN
jgi:hypothetical protein